MHCPVTHSISSLGPPESLEVAMVKYNLGKLFFKKNYLKKIFLKYVDVQYYIYYIYI